MFVSEVLGMLPTRTYSRIYDDETRKFILTANEVLHLRFESRRF